MNSTLEFVKQSWKAVLGFLGVLVGQIVQRAFSEQAVMPTTLKGWGLLLGLSFVAAVGVYMVPNKQTKTQVDTSLNKLPEDDQKAVVVPVVEKNPSWVPS